MGMQRGITVRYWNGAEYEGNDMEVWKCEVEKGKRLKSLNSITRQQNTISN